MSTSPFLQSISHERMSRLHSRRYRGVESESLLAESLASTADDLFATRVRTAYAFARTLKYNHPGLSPTEYLAHPVRVALMALGMITPPESDAVVLALLHNVFELTDVASSEITARFGKQVTDAIQLLTVDRAQDSRSYTCSYYQRLQGAPKWVRLVKLLDKLDNMFLLCLNPSKPIRDAYLADIEEYVLPIAELDLPHLVPYLSLLVDDCREIGFSPDGGAHNQENGT